LTVGGVLQNAETVPQDRLTTVVRACGRNSPGNYSDALLSLGRTGQPHALTSHPLH